MAADVSLDPTVALARSVASAVVRDAEDRAELHQAAMAIARDERALSRFGTLIATAIVNEIEDGRGFTATR